MAVQRRWLGTLLALALLMSFLACGGDSGDGRESTSADAEVAFRARMELIGDAVSAWRSAGSIEEAHASAEAAANLVVGPQGPGYGDRDGDGVVGGEAGMGVLVGLDGSPFGLASALDGNECVVADVLGGAWDDPVARWGTMLMAIDQWRPGRNTMPSLPSHPMRVVGWATFTLASDSLDEAHEYAGHAQLHVTIALNALDC
jgi:hypothetical protein